MSQMEHAESLRKKLWGIGWRAFAHVLGSAIGLALTIPPQFHKNVQKVIVILVNVHIFLVWLGWEESCSCSQRFSVWIDSRLSDNTYQRVMGSVDANERI